MSSERRLKVEIELTDEQADELEELLEDDYDIYCEKVHDIVMFGDPVIVTSEIVEIRNG